MKERVLVREECVTIRDTPIYLTEYENGEYEWLFSMGKSNYMGVEAWRNLALLAATIALMEIIWHKAALDGSCR